MYTYTDVFGWLWTWCGIWIQIRRRRRKEKKMKDYTKFLKKKAEKDKVSIYSHNNSKMEKRTPEQNEQSRNDRFNFYNLKWSKCLIYCTTPAQKSICNDFLSRLHIIK